MVSYYVCGVSEDSQSMCELVLDIEDMNIHSTLISLLNTTGMKNLMMTKQMYCLRLKDLTHSLCHLYIQDVYERHDTNVREGFV